MKILKVNPKEHISAESKKHSPQYRKDATEVKEKNRRQHIKLIKENPHIKRIICIGARDDSEVLSFRNAGFYAIGIDVTPESRYVEKLDAHKMNYEENEFDFVYASHVLEHLYDSKLVMTKIRKISKYGVFVILPIDARARSGHPTNFDMMGNPPDEYIIPDSDFDSFSPNHKIKHYRKSKVEFEIMFTWEESNDLDKL